MVLKKKVIVNIINRSYPPGPGITGESALDLTEHLLGGDFEVNIIHVNANYNGGANVKPPAGNVYKIKTFYNGKSKIPRLISNLYEGWKLVRTSMKLEPDVTICMTDPPLLNVWASLLLGVRHKWILWSMDLYPEAFAADRLISKKNIIYIQLARLVEKRCPHHVISLGPCQTAYLQKKFINTAGFTQLPCGIYANKNDGLRPPWATDTEKIYVGYCGNLGEAHSVGFLYAVINCLDPGKYSFILSVYGSKAKHLIEYARGKAGIVLLPSVKRTELSFIDIHLASLKPEWANVCVPSKTVSSVCAGSAFIYCGIPQSDNWTLLQPAGWLVEDNSGMNKSLEAFFASLTVEKINAKKENAAKLATSLNGMKEKAYAEISTIINKLAGNAEQL